MADTIKIRVTPIVNKINVRVKEGGIKGDDGYTPIKGVDYFDGVDGIDGYTPIKGTDYFDGTNGINGTNGTTPVKGVDYFDGIDGVDGVDGVTQDISGKVDKVLNKSLILDTEITRLAGVSNVDISGKENTSNKKIDVETNKTSDTFFPSIKSIVDWVTNWFVKGSGTQNYLPKFGVGGKVVGNSQIFDNGTNMGVKTANPLGVFDISDGNITMCIGADLSANTRTNNAIKVARIGIPHYNNSEELMIYASAVCADTYSAVNFGGGSGVLNAVTFISFYTAENTTTLSGTERMRIIANGNVGFGIPTPTEKLHTVGNGKFTGSVQVGDNITAASASNVGATRYRAIANNSYTEMSMQTSLSGYAWVIIKQNTW